MQSINLRLQLQSAGDDDYLYLQTQFGEDRCTQFRITVVTDPQTHPQIGLITIYCHSLACSVMRDVVPALDTCDSTRVQLKYKFCTWKVSTCTRT